MPESLWQWEWPSVDGSLLVTGKLLNTLAMHRQRAWHSERGGQLFVDPNDARGLVLAVATPPHADDRAGWTWLELDTERCRQEIRVQNEAGLRLVGHWHTHPQKVPRISPTDVRSVAQFAKKNGLIASPLAVIVGQSKEPDGIQAWIHRDGLLIQAQKRLLTGDSTLASS